MTVIYSSPIFRISEVVIELIPLRTNWVIPAPTLAWCVNPSNTPNSCDIDVNVTGCCTTPSNPMIVFVNCFVIDSLCALPEPVPVKVTASPVATYSGLVNNWNWFSSITLANTVLGNIVVTTPAILVVEPIDTAVAAIPMNVDSGVYFSSSSVLKKWLGILNTPVDFTRPTPSVIELIPTGLNVFE